MRLTAGELRSPGFDLKALLGRSKAVCEALDYIKYMGLLK